MSRDKLDVLLVEDDKECASLVITAAEMAGSPFNFNFATNGLEALDYLRQQGPHIGRVRPHFIILDLNLPILNGREVLQQMQEDPQLSKLPVVLLTTTSTHEDIMGEFGLTNDCCYTKPDRFHDYIKLMSMLDELYREGRLGRSGAQAAST